jgi:glycosyltransferase involved in cell wall biosynthesis
MKILFVSSGNSYHGIIPFIKSQGESLTEKGVFVEYFAITGKSIFGYLQNFRPLRNKIKTGSYDVVHAHYGLTGLLCGLTFSKKPLVISIMGSDIYGEYNIQGKRRYKSYLIMFLTQLALLFADRIIVKSKNIEKFVPFKKKTTIIPNGVNFDKFKPTNDELNKNTVLFLADENNPRKNFQLASSAIELLNNNKINFVSPYPTDHVQIPHILNNASVFLLTSHNEGSPNVVKEAMACNIPIVATDVGDVKEIIGETEGCYLVSFDPNDVAEKIKRALKFGKRTKGRKNIQHLESSVVAQILIDTYNSIRT